VFIGSVFTMSEVLSVLHTAGKIEEEMVKSVTNFIQQNQLHAAAVVNGPNTVSIVVLFCHSFYFINYFITSARRYCDRSCLLVG